MNIEHEILNIVQNVLNARHKNIAIDADEPLTGEPINMAADELVFVVMELMEHYNIVFDSTDFVNYQFNTVRGISEAVKRHIQG